jgi:hypothetical protein
MTTIPRSRLRRYGPTGGLIAAICWLATIVTFIAATPDPGAASPDALAAAYTRAVESRDADALAALLHEPTESAADTLLTPGCTMTEARAVVTAAGLGYLSLSGGGECGRLPIAEHDGRWLIDVWSDPLHAPLR